MNVENAIIFARILGFCIPGYYFKRVKYPELTEEAEKTLSEVIDYYIDRPITKESVDALCQALIEWAERFDFDIYD
jgi:hypothetical protein